jgi:hypothetical protein
MTEKQEVLLALHIRAEREYQRHVLSCLLCLNLEPCHAERQLFEAAETAERAAIAAGVGL